MIKLRFPVVFGLGICMGVAVLLALPRQTADTPFELSAARKSLDADGRHLLCEGGTLPQFVNAVEHYVRTKEADSGSKLGPRLSMLRFDQLLSKAYIAASFPSIDLTPQLQQMPPSSIALARVVDEALFEENRSVILEALLRKWHETGAQPTDSFLEYLIEADPASAFDATWSMSTADGRLGIAEAIAKTWLASDADAAFHHLSAVKDLPTSIRLMLVQSIAVRYQECTRVYREVTRFYPRHAR